MVGLVVGGYTIYHTVQYLRTAEADKTWAQASKVIIGNATYGVAQGRQIVNNIKTDAGFVPGASNVVQGRYAAEGAITEANSAQGNQRDSGLRHLSDAEVQELYRDSSGEEKKRYEKELKARGLKNIQKRAGYGHSQ